MAPPVTSNLIVQFDAGTIGQADNTAVASWAPASGAETAAAAQATTGQQPTYRTNQINGLPAVLFVSANSSCLDTGAWGTSYAVPNTAFVVAEITNTAADANYFTGRTGVYDYLGVVTPGTSIAVGAGAVTELTTPFTPGSAYHIIGVVYNGASSAMYVDSATATTTGTTGTTSGGNMPGMRIGSTSTGATNFPDGGFAEVLFYNRALSAGEVMQTMTYLAGKYALPLGGLSSRPQPYVARRRAANW